MSKVLLSVVLFWPVLAFGQDDGEPFLDLDGQWALGDALGAMELLLEITGTEGRSIDLTDLERESEPSWTPFDVVEIYQNHIQLQFTGETDRDRTVHCIAQDVNRVICWKQGDDHVGVAYRIATLPEHTLGDWLVDNDRRWPPRWQRISFSDNSFWVQTEDGPLSGSAYASVGDASPIELVLVSAGEAALYNLLELPDGRFVLWLSGDDNMLVLFREGNRPDWLRSRDE